MPAKAGIHLRFRRQAQENLDSGLRRNDERKSRLLVDEFRTPRLGAGVIQCSKVVRLDDRLHDHAQMARNGHPEHSEGSRLLSLIRIHSVESSLSEDETVGRDKGYTVSKRDC